jgi:hypothetical protein
MDNEEEWVAVDAKDVLIARGDALRCLAAVNALLEATDPRMGCTSLAAALAEWAITLQSARRRTEARSCYWALRFPPEPHRWRDLEPLVLALAPFVVDGGELYVREGPELRAKYRFTQGEVEHWKPEVQWEFRGVLSPAETLAGVKEGGIEGGMAE